MYYTVTPKRITRYRSRTAPPLIIIIIATEPPPSVDGGGGDGCNRSGGGGQGSYLADVQYLYNITLFLFITKMPSWPSEQQLSNRCRT